MSSQKAFGIQITQSVSANEDTNKEEKNSLHPARRGISVITPLPSGGGDGGGASELQKAFGIQISQSVTANIETNKRQQEACIQPVGVSR